MLVLDLPLTQRQREIIPLVAEGLTNKDIARALGISPGTVAVHMWRLRDRVHRQGRTAIAIEGLRLIAVEDAEGSKG